MILANVTFGVFLETTVTTMRGLVSFMRECISPESDPLTRSQQYSKLYP